MDLNSAGSAKGKGFVFIMIACFAYGIMPAVTQLSFQAGLSVSTMLIGRLTVGACLIWATILIKRLNFRLDKKHLGYLLLIGCAFIVQAVTMSESYRFLPGAIVSLLMFLYVSVVVVIEVLIGREKFNKTRIICLSSSIVGLVLVIWMPGEGLTLSSVGVALALTAAFSYGIFVIGLGEKRTRAIDSEVVVAYTLIPPILFNLVRGVILGEPLLPQTYEQAMYIFALAFISLFVGGICFAKAVKYIGASNTAIFNTMEPVVAYFVGIIVMNDEISINAVIGGVLILGAIIYLNLQGRNKK